MACPLNENENAPLLNGHTSLVANKNDVLAGVSSNLNRALALKIVSAMYSFITLGLFNSSIGAVLPLISQHYSLVDLHVSLLFLAGPIGYIIAAQSSNTIHHHFGQRGIAFLGPTLQIIATTSIAVHPSFRLVLVAFAVQGLGTGLLDGSWCAWAGSMEKANTISGLLHGSYSVGGAAGPFFVALIVTSHKPWWVWYYILAGTSVLELALLVVAFRNENASACRQSIRSEPTDAKANVKAIFNHRATWFCAAYFLAYVGTETAISGWIVTFMLRNRDATPYLASLSSSGFWIGMAMGRLALGFGTDRMGVRRATVLYLLCAVGLETLFAVLSSPVVSVVLMTLLGFVMGPLFPSGVVVLTQLLPRELHVSAVSLVASLGQVGGAFLPFAIGAFVQSLGIGVFRYAIILQTSLSLYVWFIFARLRTVRSAPLYGSNENTSF